MKKYSKLNITIYTLLITALICMTVVGCGGQNQGSSSSNDTSQDDIRGKVMRMTVSGTPKIDPATGSDYSSSIALVNIYDSLVYPHYDGSVKPLIAKEWEVDEEGLTYTFHLNEGIKFHNGDELTAEDVAFSMERLLTIGEGFAYLFTDVVESVSAVDEYTINFTLKDHYGPFVNTLSRLYILNKDQVIENIDDSGPYGDMGDYGKGWLVTNDAGSGPYTVKELQQQSHLYATKFSEYWQGWEEDAPEAIKLLDNTEGATVRTMMANKELEITDMWQSTENINALEKLPGVSIARYSRGSIQNMMLNTKKAPTDDVYFRKAISHLFDYDTMVDKVFVGSVQATGPVCTGTPGHNPDVYQYNLDLDKAKEYLSMSKYKDKLDEYPIDLLVNTDVADHEKVALSFQSLAQQVGIKVEISKAPWISIVDQLSTPETTPNVVCIDVPVHYNEAGAMLETRYHSRSVGTWEQGEWLQNSEIDKMIEDSLKTLDKEERFEKYKVIQQKLVEEICPTVWLVELYERSAYQSDYIYWPAAELEKEGEVMNTLMGYHFYFHDFKIYSDKMK